MLGTGKDTSDAVKRCYSYDSTAIRLPFESHSTAIGRRNNQSTTYVTTVGVYLLWAAALRPK